MYGSGFFLSRVDNHVARKPIKFTKRQQQQEEESDATTVPEMLKNAVTEFSPGHAFYINPLLSSGHTQTAYSAMNKFENAHHVHYKREILTVENKPYTLPTGEKLKYDQWEGQSTFAIDYAFSPSKFQHDPDHLQYKPSHQSDKMPPRTEFKNPEQEFIKDSDDKPLVIALHGLSGGSYEAYVRAVLEKVIDEPYNYDAIVLNSRGCAWHTITSPQLYNGLWTNDLRYLINEFVTKKWPNKRIYLMGFSLGGAIIANYLGQEGDAIPKQIKGSALFGTPWDFPDSANHLRDGIIGHQVYSPQMCQNLLKLLKRQSELMSQSHDVVKKYKEDPTKFQLKFLSDFDNYFTSRLFGLNSASEYYRLASPVQRLMKVRVPTLIISSLDDPITGSRSLPFSETGLNPYVTMVTTTIGGHLGWFTWNGGRWYTSPICQFIQELDKWDVDESSIDKDVDLPMDISRSWKYDRLVDNMLVE
ncbi:hypothetical protein I9W82_000749 [Candida metapsilosis]|uniref:AB hydrolase-1 domain-containing protein n=1 Tax=Candida metapsilosis TaxID=273372 RepID=A0A8H8DDN4_9ASCO|nr:hypothetical protein I9W82_000749 [Candida metapsilosis]